MRLQIKGLALRILAVIFACLFLASAAFAQSWQQWSDTDISRFWNVPTMASTHTRVSSTPMGDANYAIPIELPPSRYTPSLSISYHSQGGDDVHLGYGWSLDLPAIQKNPTPDLPEYERFVGPDGPLVRVFAGPVPLIGDYRPREDHVGARRLYHYSPLGHRWVVTGKSGEEWIYEDFGAVEALVLPDRWVLTQQTNAFGDTIAYAYDVQGRIQTITYGGNANGEPADVTVNFDYESRTCVRSDYRFDARVLHDERVHLIQVKVGTTVVRRVRLDYDDCPDRLVRVEDLAFNGQEFGNTRTWDLTYGAIGWTPDTSWELPEYFERTGTSRNHLGGAINTTSWGEQVVGSANGDPLPDLIAPTEVAQIQRANRGVDHHFAPGIDHPAGALEIGGSDSHAQGQLLQRWSREVADDIDGDGFMDVATVTSNGSVRIVWGSAQGLDRESSFQHPFPSNASTGPVFSWSERHLLGDAGDSEIGSPGDVVGQTVALLDFDGDGDKDLIRFAGFSGPGLRGGRMDVYVWDRALGQWSSAAARFAMPWCDDFASVLNADGLLTFGDPSICPLSYATHEGGASDELGGQTAGLVDMNGDGRLDFAVVTTEGWQVYLGTLGGFLDSGVWFGGPSAMMRHLDSFNDRFDTTIMMVDVDGDGLVDVVDTLANADIDTLPEFWGVWWQNTGDSSTGFVQHDLDVAPPSFMRGLSQGANCTEESGCESSESFSTAILGDWNGDGAPDVLDAESGIAWLGQRAYLLSAVDHESGTTTLSWRGSGDSYPSGVAPASLEQQHAAFSTLAAVAEVDDVAGRNSVVSYEFAGGVWDPESRRFTGFGYETVTDDLQRRSLFRRYTEYPFTGLVFEADYGPLLQERRQVYTTHAEVLERAGTDGGGAAVVRPMGESITEREFDGPIVTATRESSATFSYGTNANLAYLQLSGASPQQPPFDELQYQLTWATPGIRGLEAPCTVTLRGRKPIGGEFQKVQERRLFYTNLQHCEAGHGDITRVDVDRVGEGITAETRTWDIGRNVYGQVTDASTPSGATTNFFYDATSRYVNRTVDPLDFAATRVEDVWGNETSLTTQDGVTTSTDWDGWHRARAIHQQSATVPRFLVSTSTYVDGASPTGNVVTYQDNGSVDADVLQVMDAWGQVVQTRRAVPNGDLVQDVEYASDGQVKRTRMPYTTANTTFTGFLPGPATEYSYDEIGRWQSTTDLMLGVAQNVSTDPWITVTRDPGGFQSNHERDGLGRERFVWSSNDLGELAPSEYEYDTLGRVVAVTDPDGVITNYDWSSLGELLRVTCDDFGFRQYTYDEDSRMTDVVDAAGRHVHYVLDDVGRVLQKQEELNGSGLATVETYTWDTLVPGKLTSVVDRAGTVQYTYDGLSRVASESRTFPDSPTPVTRTMAYDHQGRLIHETHPDNVELGYTYANGRLSTQKVELADARVILLNPTYDDRGRFTGLAKDGWKLSLKLVLDDLDRVSKMKWKLGGLPLSAPDIEIVHDYDFLANGLIKRRILRNAPADTTYKYDAGGRIRKALGRGAAVWKLSDGGFPGQHTGLVPRNYVEVDATHQLDEVIDDTTDPNAPHWKYTYDAAGNVTTIVRKEGTQVKETVTLTYDGLGRPTGASSAKGSMSRKFAWDGSIPYEIVDNKTIKRLGSWENVAGEDRTLLSVGGIEIGRVEAGKKLIATMVDMHGTPTNVVNENGVNKSALELDPYGASIAPDVTPDVAHYWLGLPRSSKLGLVSSGARLFDERSRTFLQPEPLALGQGAPGFAKDPYLSNPFAYSRWNGLNRRDATGTKPADVTLNPVVADSLPPEVGTAITQQMDYLLDPDISPTRSAGVVGPSDVGHFHAAITAVRGELSARRAALWKQEQAAGIYYPIILASQGQAAADSALLAHMAAPGGLGGAMKDYFTALAKIEGARLVYHTFEIGFTDTVPTGDSRRYNQSSVTSGSPIAFAVDANGNLELAQGSSGDVRNPEGGRPTPTHAGLPFGYMSSAEFQIWTAADGTVIVAPAGVLGQ